MDVKARCIVLPASMNKNRKPWIAPVSKEVNRTLFELLNKNKSYYLCRNYGEPLKADHSGSGYSNIERTLGSIKMSVLNLSIFQNYFVRPISKTVETYSRFNASLIMQIYPRRTCGCLSVSRLGMRKVTKRRK